MRLARKPFYLVALGLILTGCSSLSQSPAPVVQGASSSRPAPGYPASSGPYVPPASAPVRAPEPAPQSEVIPYRAKTPVKVSSTPSSTNIPAYPMTAPVASTPVRIPAPVSSPSPMRDPDDDRPDSYKVKAGDTLYSIALNFGQDYREVAAWNQLDDPGVIKVDQVLRLTPPAEPPPRPAPVSAPVVERPADKPAVTPPVADSGTRQSPKAVKLPYSAEAVRKVGPLAEAAPPVESSEKTEKLAKADKPVDKAVEKPAGKTAEKPADKPVSKPDSKAKADSASKPAKDTGKPVVKDTPAPVEPPPSGSFTGDEEVSGWGWPTQGKVIARFTDSNKGLDIGGKTGQPVSAAAKGKVVYSGSGLRGYGKLIIIKHNKTFLTAYAHNSQLLVKEGQVVNKGQKIAEMGNSDADQVKLHFEIRRFGKPVDPQKYLGNAP